MTKTEYLAELDSHLITLPKEERDMAVRFYEEYFEDAGPEKEHEVMEELGKPYNLARTIIGETSLYSKSEVYIKYKESKPMPQNTTGVFASLKKPEAFENIDHTSDVMPPRARQERQEDQTSAEKDIMPNRTLPPKQDDGIKMYGANEAGHEENTQNTAYTDNTNASTNQSGNVNFDQYYTHAGENNYTPPPPQEKNGMSTGWIVFWVLITVFFLVPVVIPTAIGIIFAMLGIALAALACLVVAVIAFVSGLLQ
ncbi:MAG: DUF1700 domain-containing protein, partial [Oscillospiraceae bacterium]|nr:DUF1700 domain-containing protein [Oscillospiraceae bacterium]